MNSSRRFTLATDTEDRPIGFTELLWESDPAQWAGFELAAHRIGPRGCLHDFEVPDVLLGICIGGSAEMRFGCEAGAPRAEMRTGNFTLLNRGPQPTAIAWRGVRETLYVRLSRSRLERLLPDEAEAGRLDVRPLYAASDPQVLRLAKCMYDEARMGGGTGVAYAESLSLALAAYLLRHHGAEPPRAARPGLAFGAEKRARLRDYLLAHLGCDVSLLELARLAGLSPHYFVQLFKNSFGMTPHRYLLAERVREAQRLLRRDDQSISDIALALGFADQSHFTATFRRVAGTTPKRWREGPGATSAPDESNKAAGPSC